MSSVIVLAVETSGVVVADVASAKQAVDIRSESVPCSRCGCAEAADGSGVWGSRARDGPGRKIPMNVR
jgi:hypothetical protein